MSLVLIVDGVHFCGGIKVTHDEGCRQRLAGSHRALTKLFAHANVAALMTPGLADDRWVKRHSGEPRTIAARARIAQMTSANHPLRQCLSRLLQAFASIVELFVR